VHVLVTIDMGRLPAIEANKLFKLDPVNFRKVAPQKRIVDKERLLTPVSKLPRPGLTTSCQRGTTAAIKCLGEVQM